MPSDHGQLLLVAGTVQFLLGLLPGLALPMAGARHRASSGRWVICRRR